MRVLYINSKEILVNLGDLDPLLKGKVTRFKNAEVATPPGRGNQLFFLEICFLGSVALFQGGMISARPFS